MCRTEKSKHSTNYEQEKLSDNVQKKKLFKLDLINLMVMVKNSPSPENKNTNEKIVEIS